MSSYYSSSPRSVSSVLSIEFRQVGRLRRVAMSGCQRCLECGCLAVSDVLCADVWLSAMSCVRMSGCQRCLVCGCLAVIDVLCATGDCVLKQRSQPAAVSIPLFYFVTIAYHRRTGQHPFGGADRVLPEWIQWGGGGGSSRNFPGSIFSGGGGGR